MAVDYITTGEAIGGDYNTKGDRKQSKTPDYDGEVRLIKRSISSFFSYLDGAVNQTYKVYRPVDINEASVIAQTAITACNNIHIGYSQNYSDNPSDTGYYNTDKDTWRTAIFKYGADTSTNINCDCSSLGSYCVWRATGINIGACNSNNIGKAMDNTGHFFASFPVSQLSPTNLPYNGDVFVKRSEDAKAKGGRGGHVFMVVAGHPREGNEDEFVSYVAPTTSASPGEDFPGGSTTGYSYVPADVIAYRDQYGQTFTFAPRKIAPEDINPYYEQECGVTKNGSYAWGRFSEICRSSCDLCKMEPRKWYPYKEDGYQREIAPSLGAVMCFTDIYDVAAPGYVCIVERIDMDEIDVSLVTLDTEEFQYKTIQKRNGSWDLDLDGDGKYELRFQGFICNPGVDIQGESRSAKDTFIEIAKAQIGSDGSFTEQQTGIVTVSSAWSAAFVNAVAKKSGSLLNVIIPNTLSCSDIGRIGVIRGMGTWLEGPNNNKFPEPQVGDIALFRTNSNLDRMNRYAADKAGIIVEVGQASATASGTNQTTNYSFTAVIGDWNKKVKSKNYTTSSKTLQGIFRPRWEQVDGTTGSIQKYSNIEGLYTEGTSLEDAAIRDVRYVKLTETGFEPSIKTSGLKLCAINYTGMLANLYSTFAEVGSSSATNADLVVDLWNNSVKSVFQDDDYPMAPFVGASVEPNLQTGTYLVNDSTLNSGGSVDASATVTGDPNSVNSEVSGLNLDAGLIDSLTAMVAHSITTGRIAVSSLLGTSIEVTATYYDIKITKKITLTNTVKTIYDLLYAELGNAAGAIGIMANMFDESSFATNSVDNSTRGCGLIHWTGTRCADMKLYCEKHGDKTQWTANVEGQVGFIFYESVTNSNFNPGMESIKKVASNVDGAIRATRLFLDYFILGGGDQMGKSDEVQKYNIRSGWAKGLWSLFFGGLTQK